MTTTIRTALNVLLLTVLSIQAGAQQMHKAPALTLKKISGGTFRLEDLKGKVVLLNFWATWCPPCRQEIPELIKLQRRYGAQGLQIVGVTYPPETLLQVRRFIRRARINYPVALGTNETERRFTLTQTLPITAIIDGDGKLRDVIEGMMYPDEFEQKVKPLLASTAIPLKSQKTQLHKRRVQTKRIVVTGEGYNPAAVTLPRGVPARLRFIRTSAQSCGTEIVIPAYKINRALPLNEVVVVQFTPNRTGRFKITCGMDMFRGAIIVR